MPILSALMGLFIVSGAATTAALPTAVAAPGVPPVTALVTMTGYNAVPGQTDADPFTTASGAYSNPEIVAARSRDLAENFPFGTIIRIDGSTAEGKHCGIDQASSLIGYRVIADTMNKRMQNRVDILFPSDAKVSVGTRMVNPANALGICENVTITVVGHVDITRPSDLPETQGEILAILGLSNTNLALR